MDLIKIGKFIQERRKAKKLTQVQLAQKISVSEKTISKWECGNGFPDTSLMLPLCKVLDITANELLSGKLLTNEDYKSCAEENLITLKTQQEYYSKLLLNLEWILVWLSMVVLLGCVMISSYVDMAVHWRVILIVFGFINMLVAIHFALLIETKAGYYECQNCHHKYIPAYKQVLWSTHFGRTRKMRCPECKKCCWHKKKVRDD